MRNARVFDIWKCNHVIVHNLTENSLALPPLPFTLWESVSRFLGRVSQSVVGRAPWIIGQPFVSKK